MFTDLLKLASSYAAGRLSEPSTMAGLAAILAAWHIPGAPMWAQVVISALGAAAAILKDKGTDAFKQ